MSVWLSFRNLLLLSVALGGGLVTIGDCLAISVHTAQMIDSSCYVAGMINQIETSFFRLPPQRDQSQARLAEGLCYYTRDYSSSAASQSDCKSSSSLV